MQGGFFENLTFSAYLFEDCIDGKDQTASDPPLLSTLFEKVTMSRADVCKAHVPCITGLPCSNEWKDSLAQASIDLTVSNQITHITKLLA